MKNVKTAFGNYGIIPTTGKTEGTFELFTQPLKYSAIINDSNKNRTIKVEFSYKGITDSFTYFLKNKNNEYFFDPNCKTDIKIDEDINIIKYALAVYFASKNIEKIKPIQVEFFFYNFIKQV